MSFRNFNLDVKNYRRYRLFTVFTKVNILEVSRGFIVKSQTARANRTLYIYIYGIILSTITWLYLLMYWCEPHILIMFISFFVADKISFLCKTKQFD